MDPHKLPVRSCLAFDPMQCVTVEGMESWAADALVCLIVIKSDFLSHAGLNSPEIIEMEWHIK